MPAKKTATSNVKPASTKPVKPTKPTKPNKTPQADKPQKLSALDAAAKILAEEKEPLTTKEMMAAMVAKGYWTSPAGKTPHATLYSAILREIQTKGTEARFTKTDRGHFTLAGN